ncbi:hypothetical protein EDB84DRAFT_1526838 [Lactarius hengduanensis]|nr:hypothetical protein EDB84DRAFT_1526838 [Lactarius hengduanensis]
MPFVLFLVCFFVSFVVAPQAIVTKDSLFLPKVVLILGTLRARMTATSTRIGWDRLPLDSTSAVHRRFLTEPQLTPLISEGRGAVDSGNWR